MPRRHKPQAANQRRNRVGGAVSRGLGEHFGAGRTLYATTSSTPNVAMLASATHTLLVNKAGGPLTASVDGVAVTMAAYDVVLLQLRRVFPLEWPSNVRGAPPADGDERYYCVYRASTVRHDRPGLARREAKHGRNSAIR